MWQSIGTWNWTLINSFASWLSAIGTIAAVVFALWIANRDRRIHLKVVAGIRVIAALGQSFDNKNRYINISVTNVGYRSARINVLSWKLGPFKKSWLLQLPPRN